MSYGYEDSLPPDAQQRYSMKLRLSGLEKCPYKLPADMWVNNPVAWPELNYKDVYTYLIKSPRLYSLEAMENHRSLEAHTVFVSGWVQTVFHMQTKYGHTLLKADVKPSWRVTDEPYHPWICLSKAGPVISAHCDCMAGLGETCSHVGAMLFKIEAAVRLGLTASTCTDKPCVWNQCFAKTVSPAKIADINFYKMDVKDKLRNSSTKKRVVPSAATAKEQMKFITSIAAHKPNSVGLSTFKEFSMNFTGLGPASSHQKLPLNVRTLLRATEKSHPDDSYEDTIKRITLSKEQIDYLEEVTRNQASSSVWHEHRIGRITASVTGECLKTSQTTPAPSLLKKICDSDRPQRIVPAIAWGKQHEEDGFRLYQQLYTGTGKTPTCSIKGEVYVTFPCGHKTSTISKSGFRVHKSIPFLGASPDGVIQCECCGVGVLEIKCPFTFKDKNMKEILAEKSFFVDESFKLKHKHNYWYQVQMQMIVCEATFADVVVWTPLDVLIIRVPADVLCQEEILSKLQCFWKTHIFPRLLFSFQEQPSLHVSDNIESEGVQEESPESGPVYCLCKTTEDSGDMVACDRCDQWYHPKCLGLKRLPRSSSWYCPKCRKIIKKGA